MQQTVSQTMDIRKILSLLPHRYPFALVDRVVELVPGSHIKAYKNVTFNEPFFQGHFPDIPIMPGVLILEAFAQTAGLLGLTEVEDPSSKLLLFTGIEKAKFRKQVVPGDRLDIECSNLKWKMQLCKVEARAFVDGKLAAQALLTAAIADRT